MDPSRIYSKTGKGTRTAAAKRKELSANAYKVLQLIDSKTASGAILAQLGKLSEADFSITLAQLENGGYIRAMQKDDWELGDDHLGSSSAMVVEEIDPDAFVDQDIEAEIERLTREAEEQQFMIAAQALAQDEASARQASDRAAKERAQREAKAAQQAEAAARAQAEEAARLAAERAAQEEAERRQREEQARIAQQQSKQQHQEEEARRLVEEAVRLAVELRAREDAERKVKEEQEARTRAEEAARIATERAASEAAARKEAERLAQEEAERQARLAAEQRQREAEATRRAAEEQKRQAEAERKAQLAEEARLKAEAKARAEAEKAAQREAERLAREEAKRQAQQEKEARRQAEVAQKAQEEAERQAKKAEEARLKAETQARAEAEKKEKAARLEAERLARAEAERRAREEEQAKHQAEAERKARENAERQAQKAEEDHIKAEQQAAAQAEKAARQAAEQLEREAAERKAAEERAVLRAAEAARKAQQATEREAREAEAARIKAEAAVAKRRMKEEVRARAAEEKQLKIERKIQEQADRRAAKFARARAKRDSATPSKLASTTKALSLYLLLALVVAVGVMHFVNLGFLAGPIAQRVSAGIGEPVAIGGVRAALFPSPRLHLSNIALGQKAEVSIGAAHAKLDASQLLEGKVSVRTLELADITLDAGTSKRAQQWIAAAAQSGQLPLKRIQLKNITFQIPGLALPAFNGELVPAASGEIGSSEFSSADGSLTLRFTPQGAQQQVEVQASNWTPPLGTALQFSELRAQGVIEGKRARFDQIEGRVYGGTLRAKGTADWSADVAVAGSFEVEHASLARALSALDAHPAVEGDLSAKGSFAGRTASAGELAQGTELQASFKATDGQLTGIDLAGVTVSGDRSGSTRFERLSGSMQSRGGVYRYRGLALDSKQFHARGELDVQPGGEIAGHVSTELTIPSRQMQSQLRLGGKVNDVWIK